MAAATPACCIIPLAEVRPGGIINTFGGPPPAMRFAPRGPAVPAGEGMKAEARRPLPFRLPAPDDPEGESALDIASRIFINFSTLACQGQEEGMCR